ncbi:MULTISPECIES: thiamine-phosphate kinase [unclassified Brevibacillus]|uniref:thiamine-phosphate kinase n=1 Tax=unclassified Brevibacillus TaxID=2684853 RepID=UPI003568D55F
MAHDEFSLIRQWTSRSAGQEGNGLTVGIGDDAAVFSPAPEMEVVACCDAMVETVHFLKKTMNPRDIGYKAVISNVSDVAAMGGVARYALVSIAVSPQWTPDECQQIYEGIYEACQAYGVRVIGGDTVSAPDALHLSVTVLGEVEKGRAIRRSQAKPGQLVFVTGHVGTSAAGLHLLLQGETAERGVSVPWETLMDAHQRPVAQIKAGRLLLESGACSALNDVSDGLASELWEIAEASSVSILVDAATVPIHDEVREYARHVEKDPLEWAFYGGEDYQLVGTLAKSHYEAVSKQFAASGVPFTVIGEVVEKRHEPELMLQRDDQQLPLPKAGFNHFRSG